MAGYRRAGENSFTNATTFNDQIVRQRDQYKVKNITRNSRENLGIARDTNRLFPSFVPQEIYDRSVEEFNGLDIFAVGGNPDFGSNDTSLDSDNFSLYDDIRLQKDRPNQKGPNLIAPDINNLSTPTAEQESSRFTNRGFGWRDGRNEPGTDAARIGEYFSKHYNSTGDASADIPVPVLGEAKDPGTPTAPDAINYDQP